MGEKDFLELSDSQLRELSNLSKVCLDLFGVTFNEFEEAFMLMVEYVRQQRNNKLRRFFYINVVRNSLVYEICYSAFRHYKETNKKDLAKSIWHGVSVWQ